MPTEGPVRKIDIALIITVITSLLPLFANCKKKPPAPTPTPAPLSAMGVSDATWKDAEDAKWHAEQAFTGKGKYSYRPATVRVATNKIMAEQSVTKAEARALALASLERSRTESTDDLAIAIHGSKSLSI